ncbi:peptidylprolyl isomerase [Pelagibacterium xiamenense]|uniref:peptidylprolyl isomerase n=1 Tax=Pelagibacterium xiamenense TaxID=2901140 RepID=UPI001E2F9865|nr:peptidylprolyl isomerase [Pelagibacterium xiamenense]MCD7060829.1 SurA N-terminal domain-containing protein [Pelagibacterium xiamenense]
MIRWIAVRTAAVWLALGLVLAGAAAQAQSVQVTVNGTQITDQQINARAQLLRIEGRGSSNSNRTQMATDELIDDAIKLAEAERVGIAVTDAQVDQAYGNIASNMNVSVSNLNQVLTQNGVDPNTLRSRLRAAIAWQQVVRQVISPRVQISELELDIQAEQQLEETSSFDYILKEVIFVIADGSGMSASRRTAEANQYRSGFQGCGGAVEQVLQYQDAAVIDIGRRHATQMPEAIANELAGLTVGQLTRPRVTENGVSMYAICEKAEARDLTFIKQDLRQEAGQDALEQQAEAYLERLRNEAAIIRR